MGHYLKWLGSREQARGLWENKEALGKYINHLRDLMMASPESRMTEEETEAAARIRAELFISGLRGKELIVALKEKIMSTEFQWPRRADLSRMHPAELAILTALQEVEKVGASIGLTNAGLKLSEAKDLVSDFIDGKEK